MTHRVFADVYERLYRAFGPQGWWPAASPFEMMVGAVLTQNTAWTNVERAIERLERAGALTPERLQAMDACDLEACLRPSGTFRVKARRLKAFVSHFTARYAGSVERMRDRPAGPLREDLLSIPGIGPETADCILLYALEKPRFVVDAYTRRIFGRLGWRGAGDSYEEVQAAFESSAGRDSPHSRIEMFNEYHALLVRLGKTFCRPDPLCDACPLRDICETANPED